MTRKRWKSSEDRNEQKTFFALFFFFKTDSSVQVWKSSAKFCVSLTKRKIRVTPSMACEDEKGQ